MTGRKARTLIRPGSAAKTPLWMAFAGATCLVLTLLGSPAVAGNSGDLFLLPKQKTSAPGGFSSVCARYPWACARTGDTRHSTETVIRLAKAVNARVNKATVEITDRRQYGREEVWAMPTARGGDCEDFALAKKYELVSRGVPSESLLIATVLDRNLENHAVLILRTKRGDLVLDNLTSKVLPWRQTGYTFLKLQNPNALATWHAVIAGGVIKDRRVASN
ncbi:MAG: transglutaminase-like cysteine peptidase [Pseudomonadota bacterium]